MTVLMIVGGFALLVLGGEGLVRGAAALALRAGLSPLLIGLTIVGFGTSTPELLTSVEAALAGSPGIAVGNVVGSNLCNILLILGLAALIRPVTVAGPAFRRDGAALALSALLGAGVLLMGDVGRLAGFALVAALALYLTLAWRGEQAEPELPETGGLGAPAAAAFVAGGLALLMAGAKLLVIGAVDLAAGLGVSEAVIGVTIVAIGTSLPELVTSLVAAARRQGDIAFGNIVGSNIFNILGILGATALVQPLVPPAEILSFDLWAMLGATAALVVLGLTGRIGRLAGGAMLVAYLAYLATLAASA
ncbi:MAG: calcium/sodium antiporter [Pikeienuella sp.]|uniref:calcium/sodium antiporter n=1 Tax=Pikeienuella sp. TaxID=2831957 RepID=UPI00391D050E